ncbi:MAG: hypothetical protein HY255_10780 [Betaproteobacteria bacterium]|nr:hypothetical protein [Betaproteobacteria bacterium]
MLNDPVSYPAAGAVLLAKPGGQGKFAYREAYEQFDEACLWFDVSSGRVVDANESLLSLLAYEPTDLIGAQLSALAPSAGTAESRHTWRAVLHGDRVCHCPLDVVGKTGVSKRMVANTYARGAGDGEECCDLLVLHGVVVEHSVNQASPPTAGPAKQLAYEIAAAETRERQKIANGLHDEIGQVLAIVGLKLGGLGTSRSPEQFSTQVKELLAFVSQAAQATRSATFELSCPLLQHLGLQAAIEGLAERLSAVSELTIRVEGSFGDIKLAEPVSQVLFRVVRELLMNVLKHAQAQNARIEIESSGTALRIIVADDGIGMRKAARKGFGPDGGYGLLNVEAQMQAIGGNLTFQTPEAGGTRAELTLVDGRA